jgi:hypothetical protein
MAKRSKKKAVAKGSRRNRGLSKARAKPQAASQPRTASDPANRSDPRHKIFARNLTARAAYLVPGNPVVTRPEDAVANCFPGLEMDVRNLDRRFFPGLVFEFVDAERFEAGARLAYVDLHEDPDLKLDARHDDRRDLEAVEQLREKLIEEEGNLAEGVWLLAWIKQNGKRISVLPPANDKDVWPDVWRIVRSLELGPVTIGLKQQGTKEKVELSGWRRRFTDETTGVINGAYQPGELMQGLCSPWQHDFRDCACFYWASNHPDIVLGERYPGEPPDAETEKEKQEKGQEQAHEEASEGAREKPSRPAEESYDPSVPLDWLRSDRTPARAAEALGTIEENRPYQIDHFQVNQIWQNLNIVVEGREITSLYIPQTIRNANPLESPGKLAKELVEYLGPLELALTFEYLYAWSSLRNEEEVKDNEPHAQALRGALAFAREQLLLVAVSEMQHLRWVNQLLWRLYHAKLIPHEHFPKEAFEPVLQYTEEIPMGTATALMERLPEGAQERQKRRKTLVDRFVKRERGVSPAKETRNAELRPLTPAVILDFIAVEHPSGAIDGAYAKVIATLRQAEYPEHLVELALRISSDGVLHEKRFREIRDALSFFFPEHDLPEKEMAELPYLRKNFGPATIEQAEDARGPLTEIKDFLRQAYFAASERELRESGDAIVNARSAMTELRIVAEALAEKKLGIPFFDMWDAIP